MLFSRSTFVLYEYDPSLAAAVIFAALFILTTGFHFYQRIRSHAKYFNPFIVGGVFQVIGYIVRAKAHYDQTSTTLYSIQTLLLLLAPTLYAASIYMVLGRIITFLNAQHLSVIPVKWMTKIFVSGDILSFILQGAGGGIMANGSTSSMKIGQWVIVVGLCVQLLFFGAFLIASITFHCRINRNPTAESDKTMSPAKFCLPKDWRGLLFACYFVSVLILIRSVYRLIEFAQGNSGYVISHEVFLYVLDASMMFLVMLTMNLFHPSIVLQDGIYHQRIDLEELSLRREGGDV
ncbi:RTA1 domain-containing protein [Aspergillus vadensis CBS 113365]|uniref:RTM1-like protein n=1 Tax=Aspergillus vadensis (strain CBS 113365 / IMI 142717 / IBT 24658) TaxID=1448311 RepID=A0A319D478_ASPVC|nr:RTM1-like protein [Aspergillus vadensis CBS 113365]PYH74872.1 RTM1-like protein [Aspergillus vadensis CBS 113365]